jgi:hypothetical protein
MPTRARTAGIRKIDLAFKIPPVQNPNQAEITPALTIIIFKQIICPRNHNFFCDIKLNVNNFIRFMVFDNTYVLALFDDTEGRNLPVLNRLTDQLKTTHYSCKKKQIICIISPNRPPLF